MLGSILQVTSRWPLARLHGGMRVVEPLMRASYRRRVVEENLKRAFPDADTAKLVREFYAGFCQASAEVVRSLGMEATELRERVTFEGAEALDKGNALLLMAHHGNLIWAITALAGEIAAPVSIVYKPPHTPAVRSHLMAVAERFGLSLVPVKDLRRAFLKQRQERPVWDPRGRSTPRWQGSPNRRVLRSGNRVLRGPGAARPCLEMAGLLPVLSAQGTRSLPLPHRQDRRSAPPAGIGCRSLCRQVAGGCRPGARGLAVVAQAVAGLSGPS